MATKTARTKKPKVEIPDPTETVIVPMHPEVQAVHDIVSELLPHELLLRISRGLPVTERFREVKRAPDGSQYLQFTTELHYPSVKESQNAARDCAQFFSPKLANKQVITEVEKAPSNIIQIPVMDSLDDWEQIAIQSQTESIKVVSSE